MILVYEKYYIDKLIVLLRLLIGEFGKFSPKNGRENCLV